MSGEAVKQRAEETAGVRFMFNSRLLSLGYWDLVLSTEDWEKFVAGEAPWPTYAVYESMEWRRPYREAKNRMAALCPS